MDQPGGPQLTCWFYDSQQLSGDSSQPKDPLFPDHVPIMATWDTHLQLIEALHISHPDQDRSVIDPIQLFDFIPSPIGALGTILTASNRQGIGISQEGEGIQPPTTFISNHQQNQLQEPVIDPKLESDHLTRMLHILALYPQPQQITHLGIVTQTDSPGSKTSTTYQAQLFPISQTCHGMPVTRWLYRRRKPGQLGDWLVNWCPFTPKTNVLDPALTSNPENPANFQNEAPSIPEIAPQATFQNDVPSMSDTGPQLTFEDVMRGLSSGASSTGLNDHPMIDADADQLAMANNHNWLTFDNNQYLDPSLQQQAPTNQEIPMMNNDFTDREPYQNATFNNSQQMDIDNSGPVQHWYQPSLQDTHHVFHTPHHRSRYEDEATDVRRGRILHGNLSHLTDEEILNDAELIGHAGRVIGGELILRIGSHFGNTAIFHRINSTLRQAGMPVLDHTNNITRRITVALKSRAKNHNLKYSEVRAEFDATRNANNIGDRRGRKKRSLNSSATSATHEMDVSYSQPSNAMTFQDAMQDQPGDVGASVNNAPQSAMAPPGFEPHWPTAPYPTHDDEIWNSFFPNGSRGG